MAKMRRIDIAIEALIFADCPADPPMPAPTDAQVGEAEAALGAKLPPSFLEYMQRCGFYAMPDWSTFWVGGDELLFANIVEANQTARQDPDAPLPTYFVAFQDNGEGDLYCFDTRLPNSDGEYPVILFDTTRSTKANLKDPNPVAKTFADWLCDEVRQWG
ncbi:MAG: SMI1/KNR4 family protein [Planctomycetota bacterium]